MEEGLHLINYTPHTIWIYGDNGGLTCLLKEDSNEPIRLLEEAGQSLGMINKNIPVISPCKYRGVSHLPETPGESIIVSMLVAVYLKEHFAVYFEHIFAPDTGQDGAVRNSKGQIIGTKRLIQYK